jgi:hypothetical protein
MYTQSMLQNMLLMRAHAIEGAIELHLKAGLGGWDNSAPVVTARQRLNACADAPPDPLSTSLALLLVPLPPLLLYRWHRATLLRALHARICALVGD